MRSEQYMANALPIDPLIPDVIKALELHHAAVLSAPPGAGKTTRVPPALIRSDLLERPHQDVLLLQPRRVAARAAAARIAEEQGWTLGQEVGYHIRFDRCASRETRVHVLTEGILTRRLLNDPWLEGVGAVVLDEFHERNIHTDVALALLREVREAARPDLHLLVMSATLDAAPLSNFLENAPVLRSEGHAFPVSIEYLESPSSLPVHKRVFNALNHVLTTPPFVTNGEHILVFLPGLEEIRRTIREIEHLAARQGRLVLTLHGQLSAEEQDKALRPSDVSKIILATNVAETSLTIDGVTVVIDTGLVRNAHFDAGRGFDRLELEPNSLASADQRAGRAGRTAPGRCLRLWSARENQGRPRFDTPEIQRVDLTSTVLALHAWGHTNPVLFPWFEAPPSEALASAERLLRMLGALDPETGRITPLGHQIVSLPVHPRLARLLIEAIPLGLESEAAVLAALLTEKDILDRDAFNSQARPPGRSDLLLRLELLDLAGGQENRSPAKLRSLGLDPAAVHRVHALKSQLLKSIRRMRRPEANRDARANSEEESLLKLLLVAFPDRVTRRREQDHWAGLMVGGLGVRLETSSVVRHEPFFLSLDPRTTRRKMARDFASSATKVKEARVKLASALEIVWLDELFPRATRHERMVRFEETRGRAISIDVCYYHDLQLGEDRHGQVSPPEASQALADHLAGRAESFVRRQEAAARWLDRLACLSVWMPELSLPDLQSLDLPDLVKSACLSGQVQTIDQAERLPWLDWLRTRLTLGQTRLLDEHAPDHVTVPSGSRIRLLYEPGRPPILSVRLQELFGWPETPRIAGGRVAVLLHLLGPNFRPVQVTDDLRSFWTSTYFQVRKDLRARYPKHSWPEDPWSARPEAKGRRRP